MLSSCQLAFNRLFFTPHLAAFSCFSRLRAVQGSVLKFLSPCPFRMRYCTSRVQNRYGILMVFEICFFDTYLFCIGCFRFCVWDR